MTTAPLGNIMGNTYYVCLFITGPSLVKDEFLKGISLFIVIGANTGSFQLQTKKNHKIKKINQTGVRKKRDLEEEVKLQKFALVCKALELECKK